MEEVKFTKNQIDALLALSKAYAKLADVWEDDGCDSMTDAFSGDGWLPRMDLYEASATIGNIVEQIADVTEPTAYYVNLDADADNYLYIYRAEGETIYDELGQSTFDGDPATLFPISAEQYQAVGELKSSDKYVGDYNDMDRIINLLHDAIKEHDRMREFYGN